MDRRRVSGSPPERPAGPAVEVALPAAVLCGVVAAGFALAAGLGSLGAIILVFLDQLPLFLAGLWLGFRAAILAGLTAVVVLSAMSPWRDALFFALTSVGPAVFLMHQALLQRISRVGEREWYPIGLLVTWLAGLGLLILLAAFFAFGGPSGIEKTLQDTLHPAFLRNPDLRASERTRIIHLVAAVLPGAAAASWMVMTAMNAALAQGVLARFGASLRPSPDLAELSLPLWLGALFVAAAAAAAFGAQGRFFGINVMIVLGVPLCLAGLGVLHSIVRAFSRPAMLLTIFYILAGLFGWPLIFLALLGLLDVPLGLRRRLERSQSQKGEFDG